MRNGNTSELYIINISSVFQVMWKLKKKKLNKNITQFLEYITKLHSMFIESSLTGTQSISLVTHNNFKPTSTINCSTLDAMGIFL